MDMVSCTYKLVTLSAPYNRRDRLEMLCKVQTTDPSVTSHDSLTSNVSLIDSTGNSEKSPSLPLIIVILILKSLFDSDVFFALITLLLVHLFS